MCRAGSTTLCNGIGKRYLCCRSKWGMPMTGTNGFAIVQTLGPLSCPFPPVCNFTSSNEVKRYRRQGAGGGGRQGRPTTSKVNTTQTISDSCTAQAHFCADSLPLSLRPPASKSSSAFCTEPSIVKFSYSQILPKLIQEQVG